MNRSAVSISLSCVVLCSCASSPKPASVAQPSAAQVDADRKWAAFEQADSRYYQLDKQDFAVIDCDVDVPVADKLMQQMRLYLMPFGDKVSLSDTLAAYHLTYSKRDGLHIIDPTVDVVVKPGVKAVNPAMAEGGRQKLQEGMRRLATGVDTEVFAVINLLESPKRDAYDILYVNQTPDGYSMSFRDKKSGAQVTGEAIGHKLDSKITPTSNLGLVSYHEEFDAMPDGKLLVKTLVEDVDQAQLMKSHSVVTLVYQSIGDVTFPKHIAVKAAIDSMQATHQDVDLEIELQNCRISK